MDEVNLKKIEIFHSQNCHHLRFFTQNFNFLVALLFFFNFFTYQKRYYKVILLAGLHKVHPAYRMVNAVRAGGRL
jgi:hypothetical protein